MIVIIFGLFVSPTQNNDNLMQCKPNNTDKKKIILFLNFLIDLFSSATTFAGISFVNKLPLNSVDCLSRKRPVNRNSLSFNYKLLSIQFPSNPRGHSKAKYQPVEPIQRKNYALEIIMSSQSHCSKWETRKTTRKPLYLV